jgi:hypothetical protein
MLALNNQCAIAGIDKNVILCRKSNVERTPYKISTQQLCSNPPWSQVARSQPFLLPDDAKSPVAVKRIGIYSIARRQPVILLVYQTGNTGPEKTVSVSEPPSPCDGFGRVEEGSRSKPTTRDRATIALPETEQQ